MKQLYALALLAAGVTTSAEAALIPTTWTDSADLGPTGQQYIPNWGQYQYVHNINDNGYRPGVDLLSGFSLAINIVDDSNHWSDLLEIASIDLTSDGDLDGGWSGVFGYIGGDYGWSFEGLTQLRSDGTLSVTIRSLLGDFNLVGSTLTARGQQNTNVPEPGALGLLGVGLLGMAISVRRRKQTSR